MRQLAIVIFIIIILIMLYILFLLPPKTYSMPIESYSNIVPKLKTGDIILFACNGYSGIIDKVKYFCRTSLLDSNYGHVGIIVRDNDKLFLLECTDYEHSGDKYSYRQNKYGLGGVRLIEFDIAIKEYYREYNGTFGVRYISQEIPNRKIFANIKKYENMTFDSKPRIVFLALVDLILSHDLAKKISNKTNKENRLICSEFIHQLLYDCGVLKGYHSKIFWPFFYDSDIFQKYQIIKYSDVQRFNYV